MSCNTA